MADLYRKTSIEKLSNPEQLDKSIVISSPMSWLVLIGVALIVAAAVVWSILGTLPSVAVAEGIIVSPEMSGAVYAECQGVVVDVEKKNGDFVSKDDVIMKLECSDNKTISVCADVDGVISEVLATKGNVVYTGQEVARFAPNVSGSQVIMCYVPLTQAAEFENGMTAQISPYSIDSQKYGHMEGEIIHIGKFAASTTNLTYVLGTDNLLANKILESGPVVEVMMKLKTDSSTDSGYYWSNEKGSDIAVSNGMFVSANVVVDECAPITKLFGSIKEMLGD